MCAEPSDLESMAPTLVLTLDSPVRASSLRCVGTLDHRTKRHLVAAVEEMLLGSPDTVAIDVEQLRLADAEAANALTTVQHMVREAGIALRWHGVGADLLRRAPALDYRSDARRASSSGLVRFPRRPSAGITRRTSRARTHGARGHESALDADSPPRAS